MNWLEQQLDIGNASVHVVQHGTLGKPVVFCLHGWPQDWSSYRSVMRALAPHCRMVAMDLPGIGLSRGAPASGDKRTLAGWVDGVIRALELEDVTLVGHDIGAQVAYAFLQEHAETLAGAVLMDIVIPGVPPWGSVIRNPHLWHFAFHAVPGLPELLVHGHVAPYFDFFYDALAARPDAVSRDRRAAYAASYANPGALHAGFEWYRAFAQDEKDNAAPRGRRAARTPVLYLRGEAERGSIEDYLDGLQQQGLQDVRGEVIPASGHFALDEQPAAVARILRGFVESVANASTAGPRETSLAQASPTGAG
jgi:pimeloyl-ACP methyl ester carboxylesterase